MYNIRRNYNTNTKAKKRLQTFVGNEVYNTLLDRSDYVWRYRNGGYLSKHAIQTAIRTAYDMEPRHIANFATSIAFRALIDSDDDFSIDDVVQKAVDCIDQGGGRLPLAQVIEHSILTKRIARVRQIRERSRS